MELIISSGLMDVVDEIRIFVGGTEDQIIKFKKSISCYPYTKIKIVYEQVVNTTNQDIDRGHHNDPDAEGIFSEKRTMHQIWLDCNENDFYFLYLQFKSITAFYLCWFKGGDYNGFKERHIQRKVLDWGNIERWKICAASLDNHNMSGVSYRPDILIECIPNQPKTTILPKSYRGNIWWSKSSYIKTLNDINDPTWWNNTSRDKQDLYIEDENYGRIYLYCKRFEAEFWPASGEANFFNIDCKDSPYDCLTTWKS